MSVRPRLSRFAVVTSALFAGFAAGCSNEPSAQARNEDDTAKPRAIETDRVSRRDIQRAVDVTGTLAAEDQVTISSQAEGAVSRVPPISATVRAGQALVELDREKLQYNLDQQKAALARALAKYGANEPGELPPIEQTPDVQKAAAELASQAGVRSRRGTAQAAAHPETALDDADTTLRAKQAAYDSALQNARNLRADIDASDAMREARRSPAARRDHPRAVRRLRPEAAGLARRVREEPDAGDEHRARRSAEGAGEIPEAHGAVGQGRPDRGAAGGRVSGQDVHRRRCRASARPSTRRRARSRSKRSCPTTTRC